MEEEQLLKNPIKIKCAIKTLSSIIESIPINRIDLLKIDCEGNEQKVIDGIEKNDWNIISQIYSKIFSTLVLESKDRDYWTTVEEGLSDSSINIL